MYVDITIENKSVFWKAWRDRNVLFVQDLLNYQGNYLSPLEISDKYNVKVKVYMTLKKNFLLI